MINFLKKTLTRVAQFHHIHCTRSEQRRVKSERSVGNLFDSIFKRLDGRLRMTIANSINYVLMIVT